MDISQVGLTNLIEFREDLVDVVLELLDLGVNQLALFTGALDEELGVGAPVELLDTRSDLIFEVLKMLGEELGLIITDGHLYVVIVSNDQHNVFS